MSNVPDSDINKRINSIIRKLSEKDYKKVKLYIEEILEDRYSFWEEAMGEDL